MSTLNNIKKVYVHAGKFNVDDIISAALIKRLNPEIEFIRVEKAMKLDGDAMTMGLGGGMREIANRSGKDVYGNPYCKTSNVYERYGEEILKAEGIENIDEAMEVFYDRYIERIAIGTRFGFHKTKFFGELDIIRSFMPEWYEEFNGDTNWDEQFNRAVDFMVSVLDNWFKSIKEEADYSKVEDEIWKKADETQEDGIFVLERHIPWQTQVKKNPDTKAKIIVFKSNRGGYNIVSKNTEEILIQDSDYLSFVHPSGFMGVAESLDNALMAARQTISMMVAA